MNKQQSFFKSVCAIAIPVTLQSMLQSSFSIVDQIMIGQLGSVSIAGVGLAGKFASIYTVVISAVGAVAGIMISQYWGQKNKHEIRRSFWINMYIGMAVALLFTLLCLIIPTQVMGLYTKETDTCTQAAGYLFIISGTYIPMAITTMLSAWFRCAEKPGLPLYAGIASALLNTGLNYILIFGKLGFTPMGAQGAAIATVISQIVGMLIMLLMMPQCNGMLKKPKEKSIEKTKLDRKQYLGILLPILVCEVVWSLGENVYAAVYGHMGTEASAAMTLINPIQGLLIGALCGLSQAASIIIGKKLGKNEYNDAYVSSKKLMVYGAVGAAVLSLAVVLTSPFYVKIYQVENAVKDLTVQILIAYALIAPFKVLNMILGGGILRSGGKTKYVMFIDAIGTWGFGVPLALISAFLLNFTIPYVYFILSLEECVRFGISLALFRRKKWMNRLNAGVKNKAAV